MTLKEKLKTDMNDALKSGDQIKRQLLGMALTAVKNKELVKRGQLSKTVSQTAELEKQSELTDEETVTAIAGEVKKRKEAAEIFAGAGRQELADKEMKESEILQTYLPTQLAEEALREIIKQIIAQTGAKDTKDMGKVIGAVMAKCKGQADGTMVSRVVKEELNK